MADLYVRSATGNNSNSGESWALAKATISGALAAAAAGDRVFVSKDHAEQNASGTWTLTAAAGTLTNPVSVICVDDTGDPMPPTTMAKTATVTSTATALSIGISIAGWSYWYGIKFVCAAGNTGDIMIGNTSYGGVTAEDCEFHVLSTAGTSRVVGIGASSDNGPKNRFLNCWVAFGSVQQRISILGYACDWVGGGLLPSSVQINQVLFSIGTPNARFHGLSVRGFDASRAASSVLIFGKGTSDNPRGYIAEFVGGKLPAGWNGGLHSSIIYGPGPIIRMVRCDSSGDTKRSLVSMYGGHYRSETLNTRNGGATEDGAQYSFRILTESTARRDIAEVRGPEVYRQWPATAAEASAWTAGSPVTVSLEVLTDGLTLTNNDCWLEVFSMAEVGSTLMSAGSGKSPLLSAAVAHPASSSTWNTTGIGNPVSQRVSLTVAPARPGLLAVRLVVARPSSIIFVCPKVEVAL